VVADVNSVSKVVLSLDEFFGIFWSNICGSSTSLALQAWPYALSRHALVFGGSTLFSTIIETRSEGGGNNKHQDKSFYFQTQ
jgi:hypothetical protein